MKSSLNYLLDDIKKVELIFVEGDCCVIDESYKLTTYLRKVLEETKDKIFKEGFEDESEEINFFKNIKPQILGKLIFYNKVYRIETSCPVNSGNLYQAFFAAELEELKTEYKDHISNSDFYRYYRSGRTDKDNEYYLLGKINYHNGLSSIVFEIDSTFSTYYDYKVAKIIANELLYHYLLSKTDADHNNHQSLQNSESAKDLFWTDSKNSLIELIYALHASGAISHGKVSIRKINLAFFVLFKIHLGDIHHAFHRMKDRTGSRTAFIDQLKLSLEDYMNKNL
ncbi:RteC domain-containing protein [Flavobacterium sp. 7A]|uniref:RteC domain-containing protein n=1 Tax=Flavobacterium sp. 7A TaxID=2940571 RepID=UPI0022270946|nr:RteC domain-containing protein [Flavobacterium sp. 7A]MCW2121193.1 hypothetical protein [Flavobacterium sp. 7A]